MGAGSFEGAKTTSLRASVETPAVILIAVQSFQFPAFWRGNGQCGELRIRRPTSNFADTFRSVGRGERYTGPCGKTYVVPMPYEPFRALVEVLFRSPFHRQFRIYRSQREAIDCVGKDFGA